MNDIYKNSADESALPASDRKSGFLKWLTGRKNGSDLLPGSVESDPGEQAISDHERVLLSNILKLRNATVVEVMIPRADIFAVDVAMSHEEILELLAERQFSRVPVFKSTLDDVLGTIHIKDVMAALARGETIQLEKLVKDVPIVSPAMNILDLLLKMRQSRRHMAFVVDEYGGIDGLVTINDVLEAIIGEVYDEHDRDEEPKIIPKDDGSVLIEARLGIADFETRFGAILTEEEREDSDTLGGLVFSLAGRVPARGEMITHGTGMVFEVLDADPRRINLLKIRNIPAAATEDS